MLPGDPARTPDPGPRRSPKEQLDAFRAQYGLDQPLPQQFLTYLKNTAQGDLGVSIRYNVPVSELIVDRMWPTIALVGVSTLLATVIGVYLGMVSAWRRGGGFDRFSTGTTLTLYSMPEWWLGLLLIAGLVRRRRPAARHLPDRRAELHRRRSVEPQRDARRRLAPDPAGGHADPGLPRGVLPDHAVVAPRRAGRGLPGHRAGQGPARRARYAAGTPYRNALLPTTTLAALNIGFVVSGAITIETIFSIPGLGLLSYEALSIPDYDVLQGTFLLASGAVIAANLVANLIYGVLDPRVRT